MKISPKQRILITESVNDIFYRLQARLLGRFFKGPKIYFSVVDETDPIHTLEGAYRYTLKTLYGADAEASEQDIKDLTDISHNYMEAERLKRVNKILQDIAAADTRREAAKAVSENIDKATSYMDTLAVTETRIVQAHAEKDGITRLASSIGIDDPIVAKLGITDTKLCKACRKLWHRPGNIAIPRVYKLSELKDGYNKSQNDPIATHNPTHPNCRHVLTMIPPGYGFDQGGVIKFIGFGHDEYAHQQELDKNESYEYEDLEKYQCNHDHIHYRS